MKIFGTHDDNTIEQFEDVSSRAVKSALMADGHLGKVMPIGGVAAYDNKVSVVGVGSDIGCGNCAIKTNLTLEHTFGLRAKEIRDGPYRWTDNQWGNSLADEIFNSLEFGLGTTNALHDAPRDHRIFHEAAWWIVPQEHRVGLMEKARNQLGTIGSGNHYVDIFVDEDGYLWVGVHFGSRGFGHTVASNFIALSQGHPWGFRGAKEIEVLLDLDTQLGKDYWALMELAGRYAYAGRAWVARKVVSIMGGQEVDMVHNHHNFAWKEIQWVDSVPRELIVVRKGATPAFPGQRGFVGGSMGDDAVILEGTHVTSLRGQGNTSSLGEVWETQEAALYSTVHGAGRVMSRTQAKGKVSKAGVVKKVGKVTQEMMDEWLTKKGVVRRGGDLDESPHAYRRLDDVLKAQGDTVTILNTLRPLIVCMAPGKLFDPYKD